MSELAGQPTAAELVAAVAEFLETEVAEATTGAVKFHNRVAVGVLRMVERELLADAPDRTQTRLAGLGFADEAAFAEAIRRGELDDRDAEVVAALRDIVDYRLAIVHPGYQNE
ncbi:DUF6285 domain-containing protein [Jongsikchunia kroppenstedtii]|uniref:DUF6285 domain-containing protein n=1 Tax=Jongsikchunia kroppenstedtii TaxID=1121721 RepID=UPI000382A208|nr:DUF6285 domain-containing protein [Jongsikchunia kroppenstedtii]